MVRPLLRNASNAYGLTPTSVDDSTRPGKTFDVRDPEAHIRRLMHFGAGMGEHLASTHPMFSNKSMYFGANAAGGINDAITFNEHDTDHPLTAGVLSNTHARLYDMEKKGLLDRNKMNMAVNELEHRAPINHWTSTLLHPDAPDRRFNQIVNRDPTLIRGSINKQVTPTSLLGNDFATNINVNWGSDIGDLSLSDARYQVREKLANFNKTRIVDPQIESVIKTALNNPLEGGFGRHGIATRQTHPELYSSQFFKVAGKHGEDVIDLGTGTWAEVHPEGYFPN
jgi:hypothetical protein